MGDTTDVAVNLLRFEDSDRLRAFLDSSAEGSLFHLPEWHKFIEATYGHRCYYWGASKGRDLVGVFPVTRVSHPFVGAKMVALPYQMHCGLPLAHTEDLKRVMVERAVMEARRLGVRHFEIRSPFEVDFLGSLGFAASEPDLIVTSTPLEGLELRQMRRGHRKEVRYALRRGVKISETESLPDVRQFYKLFLRESRALAAPRPSWHFYMTMKETLKERCRLLVATASGGELLGGLLLLEDGTNVFARDSAYSSSDAVRLKIGKGLIWEALQGAADRGNKTLHYGISWARDTGLIRWKEGWNGTSRPVYQYTLAIRAEARSSGSYFSGFRLAKAVWRRLPLRVVELAGHQVTRWVC